MMNYHEFIQWLEEVPLYGHKDGTNNIRKLMERFGNPQQTFRVIHVAGTNGKGSCCAMLSSVFLYSASCAAVRQGKRYFSRCYNIPHFINTIFSIIRNY